MGSFKDVVGHKQVIGYIQKAIEEEKVSHAYLLSGEKGSGKKLLAQLFATTLLCEKGGVDPCNHCHSCIQAESGNHPDIIMVTPEKPGVLGIEDIRRQVNDTVHIKPYQGRKKIYLIEHVQTMTTQAANALLKTMEEPPSYVVLLLMTENHEVLLPTITSRCVMLKLRHLRDTLIRKYLMEVLDVPKDKANMCAAFAQGNLGRAVFLTNTEEFYELREEAIWFLKNFAQMDFSEMMDAVKRVKNYKLEIEDYFDIMMVWYRDVLLYKATKEIDRLIFSDQLKWIKEHAERSSYEGIEQVIKSLEQAKTRLKANVNFELVMELLFLTMKEN